MKYRSRAWLLLAPGLCCADTRGRVELDHPRHIRHLLFALAEMTGHIGEFVDGMMHRLEDEESGVQSLFQALVEFFEEDGWVFVTNDDEPALCLSFCGDNGRWSCLAGAREAQSQVVFYSLCPIHAPEDRR